MDVDGYNIWAIIAALGIGTFLIRFSFLGLVGDRPLPEWLLRHLRYTPVAVMPALVAPLVMWPPATGGETDLARLLSAFATVIAGVITKSLPLAIVAGGGTLYAMLYLLG